MVDNPRITVINSAGTAEDNQNTWKKNIENTLTTKANVSLNNLDGTGEARFSEKANISLNNLNAVGEARFSNLLKVPAEIGETFTTEFPLKADRANKYMLFDENGNVTVGTGGGGSGDVTSSISSTADGKLAVFDGTTGKIIKDTTLTGMLKASSGVLTQAISDTDYVSVSAFNTLDGRVGTAETDIGTLESSLTSKASIDLDNISSAGVAVIQSYATGGGANVSLSNLDATGEARFTGKANISLDNINSAGIAVIQSYATGGANTDLSNLSATGQAVIDGKANTSLSNITSAGNTVIQTQAKLACQPLPVSTSGAIGELKFIYGSASGTLSVPAGGTWAIFCKYGYNNTTGALFLFNAQFPNTSPCVVAGGTLIAKALSGYIACAIVMRIA